MRDEHFSGDEFVVQESKQDVTNNIWYLRSNKWWKLNQAYSGFIAHTVARLTAAPGFASSNPSLAT